MWGPLTVRLVGDAEEEMVACCTNSGHDAPGHPSLHPLRAQYVQITGHSDFTQTNIPAGDEEVKVRVFEAGLDGMFSRKFS